MKSVRRAAGKKAHVASAQDESPHFPAAGKSRQRLSALAFGIYDGVGIVQFDEMDLDFAVHAERKFIVSTTIPA